jgi:hypothetical protein
MRLTVDEIVHGHDVHTADAIIVRRRKAGVAGFDNDSRDTLARIV